MEVHICEHIKDDGIRCGSPAKHGISLCHFHARMDESSIGTRRGPYRVRPIDSTAAIQITITHTLQALLDDTIDSKKANSLFRGLNLALRSLYPSQRSRLSSPNLATLMQQIRTYYETPGPQDQPAAEDKTVQADSIASTPVAATAPEPTPLTCPPDAVDNLKKPNQSAPSNCKVKPKIEIQIQSNPYNKLAGASAPLNDVQLAEVKRIIRLGPAHSQFHRCTRLLDSHIALTKNRMTEKPLRK